MTSSGGEPPLRLLALDGGGIRGLSELLMIKGILHRLMIEENKQKEDGRTPPSFNTLPKPCDYFDLIGGTGTGGIIALMLGRLRMDIDTTIKHYNELARHVFSDPNRWARDSKFKSEKLEDGIKSVVEEITGDSESPLLDDNEAGICRTFVCAMNAYNMNIPVLFRTYHSREMPFDCKIWEAARATSATPTLFKPIEIGMAQPFIDGGLGHNNPSRLLLDEAKDLFGNRQIGCLVSIGAGQAEIVSITNPGIFQRIIPTDITNVLKAITTDCEATHESMLGLFANSPNTYFRLNVEQGMQGIDLSEWDKLSKIAAHTFHYLKKKEVDEKLALLVNAIRGRQTIEELISPLRQSSVESIQERKLCPLPVASFTGRKKILDKMRGYFDSDGKLQRVFVLFGLGGSGKSQIAFKFLQESQNGNRFSDIFYIDATNEQTLKMDLVAITPGNVDRSVDASLRWLRKQHDGRWMLFFDNADDVQLKLKDFFPTSASGNILITTRNQELRLCAKGSNENVRDMDHEDATNLLLHLSEAEETDENRDLAAQIVQELHHFALAISQAAAFIHCHSTLRTYHELYQLERDHLLQNAEVHDPDPYGLAVYATWKLSFDKLDEPGRSFLQFCSMLHHEGISEQMFKNASLSTHQLDSDSKRQTRKDVTKFLNQLGEHDSHWSSWDFQRVIKSLRSHSLIEYDGRNCIYSLHPLVHHWSGTTIGNNKQEIAKCVLSVIGLSISWTFNKEDYIYRQTLLKHMINCVALVKPTDIDPFVALGLALIYSEQGQWKDAEVFEVVAMEERRRIFGEDHPDTLTSMGSLATAYWNQGRLKDAEVLELVVLEKRKRVLGEDDPATLMSMGHLSRVYRSQGRWKDAVVLESVVLEKRKKLLGEDHPHTLTSMGNLANVYRDQGRWKDAEMLEVVVLETRKHLLGEDHPDTLISMGNLANTYKDQGRWKDAEVLEVAVMEKRKHLLGEDHPDTLTTMGNLGITYWSQNRLRDAVRLQLVVLEKRKHLLGEDHPDTVASMGDLASTYWKQGRSTDAEMLDLAVLEKTKKLLGDDHPHTLLGMGNLAMTYWKQGRWKDAEVLQVVVLEKRKGLLGEDHPNTLLSMRNLASTYRNQGRWKDAEVLEETAMKRKQALGIS